MNLATRRRSAIDAAMTYIRTIEQEMGVNRAALAKMREVLLTLAADGSLFSDDVFRPIETGEVANVLYRLSEDADCTRALYLSVDNAAAARDTAPHNHKTWAVIVGVQGDELNRLYERVDDESVPGRGSVKQKGEVLLQHGSGLCLMPDDIHSVHSPGGTTMMSMHMYGLGMPRQTERIEFYKDGTTGQRKPNANIRPIPQ